MSFATGYLTFLIKNGISAAVNSLVYPSCFLGFHLVPNPRGTLVLAERSAVFVEHRAVIVERRAIIVEHRAVIVERRAVIVEHRAVIIKRRAVIVEHRAVFAERSAVVTGRSASIFIDRSVPIAKNFFFECPTCRFTEKRALWMNDIRETFKVLKT
ncbi:MAG: hypothetical protein GDA42_02530, partial [Ekhidna sp.]|nr:hypothetical protein [Ekhidna sp.]